MRTILSLSVLMFVLTACLSYKELPVEYDYSYKGRFDKYRSYDFITIYDNLVADDNDNDHLIVAAIEGHMKFLGYKRKQNKPDLLLSYKVFIDSLNFRGYDQPAIEEWMTTKKRDMDYNRLKINMKEGTFLVQIFDRKQNTSIWQGYATDEYGHIDLNDYREVRNAVKSVLNKYQFFADGFLEQQRKKAESLN